MEKRLWAGRIMSGVAVLFLLFDSFGKVMRLAPVVEGTTQLGYPASVLLGIGTVELLCLVVYLIPRTSILGAILLTGYLGGAVATHVRIGSPLFSHVLFPIYVGVLTWGGLYLRDERLRALIPLRGLQHDQ
ncbi:MAG: DoxX family protein [Gemmatimonadales bacterium]